MLRTSNRPRRSRSSGSPQKRSPSQRPKLPTDVGVDSSPTRSRAPLPHPHLNRCRRNRPNVNTGQEHARRVELSPWVPPTESNVEALAQRALEAAAATAVELEHIKPQPVLDRASEQVTVTQLEPPATDTIVEPTGESFTQPDTQSSDSRSDRPRLHAVSRPPHRHPHHSHPSTPSTSPVTGLTQKADPKLPRRRTPPHVVAAPREEEKRIAPTVADRDLESSAHERPGSTPTTPIVEFAADPLDSTLPDVSTEVVAESASLATEPHTEPEPEPEPTIVGNEIKIATEPEPAIRATEPDIVTGPEPSIVSNEIKIATEPQPEPAIVSSEFEVVAELIPPSATVDQTIEQVSELGVDPSRKRPKIVGVASSRRLAVFRLRRQSLRKKRPKGPTSVFRGHAVGRRVDGCVTPSRTKRGPSRHTRPSWRPPRRLSLKSRSTLCRRQRRKSQPMSSFRTRRGTRPKVNGVASSREIATARTITSPTADTEFDVIVPSPTPAETTGRWRRLIAEAAQSADVEPAPTEVHVEPVTEATVAPAVIDLRTESQARPSPNVGAVRSPEIERLPRVGSDLREMINTIRRKTNKGVDETGGEPDSLAIGPSPERVAGATAIPERQTVNTLVRTSDLEDDGPESEPNDRRPEV